MMFISIRRSKYDDVQNLVENYEEAYETAGLEDFMVPIEEVVKSLETRKDNKEELPKRLIYMKHENGPSILFVDRNFDVFERITTNNRGDFIERSWPVKRWNIHKDENSA